MNTVLNGPLVILSAERVEHDRRENRRRTRKLEKRLLSNNFNIMPALGMYKGVSERSIVVLTKHFEEMLDVAGDYQQESILVVNEHNSASLIYHDGRSENLGTFVEIPLADIEGLDAYTIVNCRAYTVK